jgi:hypothetical protein
MEPVEEAKTPVSVRLPDELAEYIRKQAQINRRSVTAEITVMLERDRDRQQRERERRAS